MKRLKIIKSIPEHALKYYGKEWTQSFKGYTGFLDNEIVGIAGLRYDEKKMILFSDMSEKARPFKKDILKVINLIFELIKDARYPILALANPEENLSGKILIKLGFKDSGQIVPDGKVFWRIP